MKLKKTLPSLAHWSLMLGAGLTLGFLSFSGMYALAPLLPLAFTALGLSVAYEGEIYLQNIKGAWRKLFKPNYVKQQLANDYLLQALENNAQHPFFDDYRLALLALDPFLHKRLDKKSRIKKKRLQTVLRDMEKWFAQQLFDAKQKPTSHYEKTLFTWLRQHNQALWHERLRKRQKTFSAVKKFSIVAGVFMGMGTSYLLIEAIAVIPFFATLSSAGLPFVIIPLAVVAGMAYTFLTYNAITDMISHNTFRKWYLRIRDEIKDKKTRKHGIFTAIVAGALVGLAITLTVCTAGTWWTIAKETRPLFNFMGQLPSIIMGVLNPLITGFSSIFFNVQNSMESLEIIIGEPGHHHHTKEKGPGENVAQLLNPFRILLKLTVTPLKVLLFIGHLISIGVTADRVPGIPEIFSALLGIISEGFEDFHYFIGHHHHSHDKRDDKARRQERLGGQHGHNHENNIPAQLLTYLFYPLYFLSAIWDWAASQRNRVETGRPKLSTRAAWEKQLGYPKEESVNITTADPSYAWKIHHGIYLIDRYKKKQARDLDKENKLGQLQAKLESIEALPNQNPAVHTALKSCYTLFSHPNKEIADFVHQELPERSALSI